MTPTTDRPMLLRRATHLQWLTVGWNVVEGVVAVAAALVAGSTALLGFGLDSFIETSSGIIILWRIRAERRAQSSARIEAVEYRARRGVAISMWALAALVGWEAANALWLREAPNASPVGIALLVLSVGVMLWLARAKQRVAEDLHSHAMEADATQTTLCWRISVVALAGLVLNAAFGWWWADPIAALVLAGLIVREGWEAWQNKPCCGV